VLLLASLTKFVRNVEIWIGFCFGVTADKVNQEFGCIFICMKNGQDEK